MTNGVCHHHFYNLNIYLFRQFCELKRQFSSFMDPPQWPHTWFPLRVSISYRLIPHSPKHNQTFPKVSNCPCPAYYFMMLENLHSLIVAVTNSAVSYISIVARNLLLSEMIKIFVYLPIFQWWNLISNIEFNADIVPSF